MQGTKQDAKWSDIGWTMNMAADDGREVTLKVFAHDGDGGKLKKLIQEGAASVAPGACPPIMEAA
ncbi:hypothetical protein ACQP00_37870 [Dactylosporangium sp. CS-047395]|uniref:hypothetical protein n=1 Tax=Dactylosporangium sp. CS-047395 TaxID=3239936 RepID=UPI003D8CFFA9